jgi:hypothetical protein
MKHEQLSMLIIIINLLYKLLSRRSRPAIIISDPTSKRYDAYDESKDETVSAFRQGIDMDKQSKIKH